MSYVIFHVETTMIFRIFKGGFWQDAIYDTQAAALMVATKMAKAGKLVIEDYCVMSWEEFKALEKKETVINLMSGLPVVQSVNTPLCCDVSSETYWSM